MGVTVGIDLGTTNSVISYFKRGKVETISIEGKNTFPSVISVRNGEIMTGYAAKSRLIMDTENSVGSSKREMGADKVYNLGDLTFKPSDVACEILKALKEKAEFSLGEKIEGAVITVPAYFTSRQREDTERAARNAGLRLLRLMPEPTAAALSYGLNQGKDQTIMVYDLGGGTFDVSILKVEGNNFNVIAVDGDSKLGGDDFDQKIAEIIYNKIKEDTGTDIENLNDRTGLIAKQKIKEVAEKAKIELSDAEIAYVMIPNILSEYNLDIEITRDEYYEIIRPLIDKTIEKMNSVLKQAKLQKDDIDRVILVGGSTKSPIVRQVVKQNIRDPFSAPNVDEVVSNGAAVMAASLVMPEDEISDINICEITPHSLGMIAIDDSGTKYINSIIINRNSTIPATEKRPYRLSTTSKGDNELDVYVLQGENINPLECTIRGKYVIYGIEHEEDGKAVVDIEYSYNQNGVIEIVATQKGLNKKLDIRIEEVPEDMSWVSDGIARKVANSGANSAGAGSSANNSLGSNSGIVNSVAGAANAITSALNSSDHINLVMAMDISGSMYGKPLEEAQKAAKKFLNSVDLKQMDIALMAFANKIEVLKELSSSYDSINQAIDNMSELRETQRLGFGNLAEPFTKALEILGGKQDPGFIIILTDGIWIKPEKAVALAKECKQKGISIIAIGFGKADIKFLNEIATNTESAIFTDLEGLSDSFFRIAQVLSESKERINNY